MKETYEQKQDRLRRERTLIMADMGNPGFQLIMRKLSQASKEMAKAYDNPKLDQRGLIRIQEFRHVVDVLIPTILEAAMNVDVPADEPEQKWTFRGWLNDVWHCVDELIDNTWLHHLKTIFH